jgi:ribosomal protein S18 acetylase RimI-like enzyme
MHAELRKAILPEEASKLREFDVCVFGSDAFEEDYWRSLLESYWVVLEGQIVGCTAFSLNTDFQEDLREDDENVFQEGTLYIETTGILPAYRGKGLGSCVKQWQLDYAKQNGCKRIVTNCRESNSTIISLNERHGFRVIRTTETYYENPIEATVVMDILLR